METEKEKKEKEQKELIRIMTYNIINNYQASPKIEVKRTYMFKKSN